MGNIQASGAKISIRSSNPASFSVVYSRVKGIAVGACLLWGFGLIEVVTADAFLGSSDASFIVAIAVVALIGVLALWYFRRGVEAWSGASGCTNGQVGQCSQSGCDSAGGGCLAKLNREISDRISEMEKSKLAQLLRHKVGFETVFAIFWVAVGIKVAASSTLEFQVGGLAIALGSLSLIVARVYLGKAVFS